MVFDFEKKNSILRIKFLLYFVNFKHKILKNMAQFTTLIMVSIYFAAFVNFIWCQNKLNDSAAQVKFKIHFTFSLFFQEFCHLYRKY